MHHRLQGHMLRHELSTLDGIGSMGGGGKVEAQTRTNLHWVKSGGYVLLIIIKSNLRLKTADQQSPRPYQSFIPPNSYFIGKNNQAKALLQ